MRRIMKVSALRGLTRRRGTRPRRAEEIHNIPPHVIPATLIPSPRGKSEEGTLSVLTVRRVVELIEREAGS